MPMTASELPPTWQGRRYAFTLPATLWRYWATAYPRARQELRRWRRRARAIPDPSLRAFACATLRDEYGNAEGAALLALAAPPAHRDRTVRLLVAMQVMYDYLDTLTEQPVADPIATSRRLHRALTDVLGETPAPPDWYAGFPYTRDGGYLATLVATCRELLMTLPSRAIVAPGVRRVLERAGESQTRNHAAMLGATGVASLAAWAGAQGLPAWELQWWELAAAAGSSLAAHALLAAAADPRLTPSWAARIEGAYWPWICGLNTLLESVVDRSADAVTGNHSYAARYASTAVAAERLAEIAAHAARAARALPNAAHHRTVLAAMGCYYLSAPHATAGGHELRRVLEPLGTDARLLGVAVRLHRRLS
jgi:tetraprenyl-beta-curcumene synthase